MSLQFTRCILVSIIIISIIPTAAVSQSGSNNIGSVSGEPDINISSDNNTLEPGEKQPINFTIENKLDIQNKGPISFERNVSTATDLSVSVNSEENIEIISSDLSKNNVKPNESITLFTTVWVPESSSSQNLTVDLMYDYIDTINYNTTNNNVINTTADEDSKLNRIYFDISDIASFNIDTEEDSVPIGETGMTQITVSNTGDINVKNGILEIQSKNSDILFGSTQTKTIDIGDLDTYDEKEYKIEVRYRENAENKDYSISGVMTYDNKYGEQNTKRINDIIFNPEQDTDFSIEDINVNSPIGGSGDLEIELENSGETDIYNSILELSSNSGTVTLGGQSRTNSISIGDWDENEDKSVTVPISFTRDATVSDYSVSAVLKYENEDNIQNQESISGISVEPLNRQQVKADIINSDLVEGENGNIKFEITNNGPKDAENIKISFEGDDNLVFLNEERNIGSLAHDGSKSISVPVESPEGLDSLKQNVDVSINYKDSQSETQYQDSDIFSVTVEQKSAQFNTDISNNKIQRGGSKNMIITVQNNQSNKISNIEAEFSTSDPLSLDQETAYVDELNSGESDEINISVSASSESLLNTYPIKIDFEYKNAEGESKLSDVYSVPVQVEEPAGNESSINPTILVLLSIIIVLVIILVYKQTDIINRFKNI